MTKESFDDVIVDVIIVNRASKTKTIRVRVFMPATNVVNYAAPDLEQTPQIFDDLIYFRSFAADRKCASKNYIRARSKEKS